MTAQFPDTVEYRGDEFTLTGANGKGLFDPGEHGLRVLPKCTACWRGFVCGYAVREEGLVLDRLMAYLDGPAAALFGVPPGPTDQGGPGFDAVYEEIGRRVEYTGGLLIARGFIRDLYVHMGFHPAWKFREVHELIFEGGSLVREADRSQDIAAVRKKMLDRPLEPPQDPAQIREWIRKCFSLEYGW
jgi:hypothetical protein